MDAGGSLGTGAENGGHGGVDQSHVDPLRTVLGTDDLGDPVRPLLTQQLTCNMIMKETAALRCQFKLSFESMVGLSFITKNQ